MSKYVRPFGDRGRLDLFPGDFHRSMMDFFGPTAMEKAGDFQLQVDISETPETFVVKAEVPGTDPEDLDISLTGDALTIRGEKRTEEKREDENVHFVERRYGSFQRTFSFPSPVAADGVTAESKDGILMVTVRKSSETPARRIKVKAR